GVLNGVLTGEDFVEEAGVGWAKIARNPDSAVFAAKEALGQGLKLPLEDGLRLEGRLFARINSGDEARALNAAIERPS
nr:hypothetical protein [Pseudomonadota bacterium]